VEESRKLGGYFRAAACRPPNRISELSKNSGESAMKKKASLAELSEWLDRLTIFEI